MPILIDAGNKLVKITAPDISMSGQVLHDTIEDFMASPEGMVIDGAAPFYGNILVPEGKIEDENNPGVFSQIIIKLSFEWQIQYWQGSGYTRIYGAKIVGGLNNQPMKATGAAGDITVLESPVDGVTVVSSGAAEDVAAAVWEDNKEYTDGSKGHLLYHTDFIEHTLFLNTELSPVVGEGTEKIPFGVTSDCITFAELHGFKKIGILAELIVDRLIKNFFIYGVGGTYNVRTNNKNLDKSSFYQVRLSGVYSGSIIVRDSFISESNTTINGVFSNCAISDSVEVPAGGLASIVDSYALIGHNANRPQFSIGGLAGTAILELINFNGGVTITNCNKATDIARIISTGTVEIDSSCTEGNIAVIGLIKPIDNSGPNCNVVWLNIDPEKNQNIWKALFRRRHHDKVANTITIYKEDNITPEFVFDATDLLTDITPQ